MSLFRQISTVNNALKARVAYEYGLYMSSKGSTSIDNMPSSNAAFIALGFRPGEAKDIEAIRAHDENRQEAIDDSVKVINNLLLDGLNRPDLFEENAKKANAYINMVPMDMRVDVLKKVHLSRDPSIYSRLLRQREKQNLIEQHIEKGNEE